MEETSHDIVAQKNAIQRFAPQSGGNLNGKDVVFLMKEPGVDALVYDNGTYITRSGFGYKRKLNQTGGFITTIKKLKVEGYKPFNYFTPGFRERYEAEHKMAEQKKLKAQEVFPVVEKINLRQLPTRLGYEQVSIQQPRVEIPRSISQPIQQRARLNNEEYVKSFAGMLADDTRSVGYNTRIKAPTRYVILEPAQTAKWATAEYRSLAGINAALSPFQKRFNQGKPKGGKPKGKKPKGRNPKSRGGENADIFEE